MGEACSVLRGLNGRGLQCSWGVKWEGHAGCS